MAMSSTVKEVEYFYSLVADKPGESRKLLEFLSEKEVNLQTFTAFPAGEGKSQLDFFPTDPELLKKAADDAGIRLVGPKKAFLLQGEDLLAQGEVLDHQFGSRSQPGPSSPGASTEDAEY